MPLPPNYYALLGAGVVGIVCAATLYVVQHFQQDRRSHAVSDDVARLTVEMADLRRELDGILAAQKKRSSKRERRKKAESVVSSSATEDCASFVDGDSSDLEFYDVSDHDAYDVSDVDTDLEAIDQKLDEGTEDELELVVEQLHNLSVEFPENPQLLWRISKGCHALFQKTGKQEHLDRGIVAGTSAVLLKPALANVHKWLATLYGTRAKLKQIREKLVDGREFKKHLDLALELNPLDGQLHHMMGRFIYDLADMKWLERRLAAAVFTEVPTASFDSALQHFEEAHELGTASSKENMLFLAKCKMKMGMNGQAASYLRRAAEIKVTNGADQNVDLEVKQLLKKLDA